MEYEVKCANQPVLIEKGKVIAAKRAKQSGQHHVVTTTTPTKTLKGR